MDLKPAAQGFSALSQETRLQLMRVLAEKGASGFSAGELSTRLALAPSTLSFHLAALEQAGLVHATRRGRHIFYAVRIVGLRELFGFLTETCCAGRPELCWDLNRLLPNEKEEEATMSAAFNVLFLCTHNSARSIMAEAILNRIGEGKFNAYSAGSEPFSAPLPEVIERLSALDHGVGYLRSKSWTEFMRPEAPRMDFVIAMCDTLEGQVCPDFGDKAITAAWPFPDPAKLIGSDRERATLLNELYGMIRRRLEVFISLPFASLDRMAMKTRLDQLGDSSRSYA